MTRTCKAFLSSSFFVLPSPFRLAPNSRIFSARQCRCGAAPATPVVVGLAPFQAHVRQREPGPPHPAPASRQPRRRPRGAGTSRDGELGLGPGAFVSGLEFSAGLRGPRHGEAASREFFRERAPSGRMPAERTATVGDDALQDIRGAIEAGVGRSILVQNGKCRPGDERKAPKPSAVCASIVEAVDYILEKDDRSTS